MAQRGNILMRIFSNPFFTALHLRMPRSQVAPSPFKRRRVGAELMRTPPGGGQRRGPGAIPSSEPRPSLDGGEEEDRYSCDSFCVDDEEEVEFEESSQANGSQL